MLFKLQKVPFIVVSTSASKHPSSIMVASSCCQWQPSGIGLAPVIEILTSPFMIVIMLSTLRKIKTTLTERWRHTPGGKRWRNKWFSAHCDTHTHLGFCHYHINWWGNDVSNDMLNTGWVGGGSRYIQQKCSLWAKTALGLDWWQRHALTHLDIKWSPWQSYPSHLECLVTVTQRWISPPSRFHFTKGATPRSRRKAARWWWMGAIHIQSERKQGGILQTQVWAEMTAGCNSWTSSLDYAAIRISFTLFSCRWEQC